MIGVVGRNWINENHWVEAVEAHSSPLNTLHCRAES
jgi:hypothetical protein